MSSDLMIRSQRSPYGTSLLGAGAVHHIKTGEAKTEQMLSGLAPIADMRDGLPDFRLVPKPAVSRWSKLHRYSITSSARTSSDGGTSRPSALAVFTLSTRSYLVGVCTGRSAGLSPLRMRST